MGRGMGRLGRIVGRISTPVLVPNLPVMVGILDVGDGHELDIWVKDFAITPRLVGEASINVLHCGSCQHLEKQYQTEALQKGTPRTTSPPTFSGFAWNYQKRGKQKYRGQSCLDDLPCQRR